MKMNNGIDPSEATPGSLEWTESLRENSEEEEEYQMDTNESGDSGDTRGTGNCPICGKRPWYNDVPLRAFCWGSENAPHVELRRLVPSPFQPYGFAVLEPWKYKNNHKFDIGKYLNNMKNKKGKNCYGQ